MKFVYGIAGFAAGLMAGLLLGVAETRLLLHFHKENAVLFVVAITVLICVIVGVITAVRLSEKRMQG